MSKESSHDNRSQRATNATRRLKVVAGDTDAANGTNIGFTPPSATPVLGPAAFDALLTLMRSAKRRREEGQAPSKDAV